MEPEFETVEKEIGHVLEIEERIPMWKMPSTMGRDLKELSGHLENQGVEPAGAPYSRYLGVDWKTELAKPKLMMFLEVFSKKWHMMIGIPTGREVAGEGSMQSSYLPKGKYLRTVHLGPYHKLGATYEKTGNWAQENGIELADTSIESYLNDPANTAKADLETEILIPIR
jgi:effector-binding domain-containing protein